jgi:hypothetical protein
MADEPRDDYEELESARDPHRKEERDAAIAEVAARLRNRGLTVTGGEAPEDLANLLEAVERFERAVEAHGGDLMVDDRRSREPDDPHFVLPQRNRGEGVRAYITRVDQATRQLRSHPPRPDRTP